MVGSEVDLETLVAEVLEGQTVPVSRAISAVENTRPQELAAQGTLLGRLIAQTPSEHAVIGLTGPPGAGKSSLANALSQRWLAAGHGVGMTAVDPSSQRTGGALLGDRARMEVQAGQKLFIRSLASRDRLGGLAPATRAVTTVLRAAFQRTLVETVGVGQSEIDIGGVADTVVLVLQPGSGDALQFMKAGILEIPDILVVHKADLGAVAERSRTELSATMSLGATMDDAEGWSPPIILVSAHSSQGIDDLLVAIDAHGQYLRDSGEGERRRDQARVQWAMELLVERYGHWGLERVGGREAAEAFCAAHSGGPLDAFSDLSQRIEHPT